MDCKLFLCFILLTYSSTAFPKSDEQSDNYEDKDDQENGKKIIADEIFNTNSITEKRPAHYEVTEIVIDIPDTRTKGPIVTNYTIYRPLNTVLTTEDNNEKKKENITKINCRKHNKKTTVLDKTTGGKKHSLNIFHIKAEYEDKTEKVTPEVVDHHYVPHLFGIKDYLNGIKQGIINGFNSILHKHKHEGEGSECPDSFETPRPLTFLSKIHKKSSEVAHKIHNVVFGHKNDEH